MNRNELMERIASLPTFELRDTKVKTNTETGEFVDTPNDKAVCIVGENIPYVFVKNRYKLIQFSDIYRPLLDSIEGELDGNIITYGGYAMLFMFPDDENLKHGKDKLGIIAVNSVDKSSSIVIKFCVESDNVRIIVPEKIAGLKKTHTGKVESLVKNYTAMVGPVKAAWNYIVNDFPKWEVVDTPEEGKQQIPLQAVILNLHLGTRLAKTIGAIKENRQKHGLGFNLWDTFMAALTAINERQYKSDYHRTKRIERLCAAVFEYSSMLQI